MKTKTIIQFLTLALFVNVGIVNAQTLNKKINSSFKKFESKMSIIMMLKK